MLFSANDTISNVRILKYVGAGAFGEVYHAIDLAMNRECAVKYVETRIRLHLKLISKLKYFIFANTIA